MVEGLDEVDVLEKLLSAGEEDASSLQKKHAISHVATVAVTVATWPTSHVY
jgi:hypothetical protein